MAVAVALVAAALLLRSESVVHALEGSKPVGADLGDRVMSTVFPRSLKRCHQPWFACSVQENSGVGHSNGSVGVHTISGMEVGWSWKASGVVLEFCTQTANEDKCRKTSSVSSPVLVPALS